MYITSKPNQLWYCIVNCSKTIVRQKYDFAETKISISKQIQALVEGFQVE